MKKYMKAHYRSEDFGRGKSPCAKLRHKRFIKRSSKNRFNRDNPIELIY